MSYGNGDDGERSWYKVAAIDELPEGRVKTVVAGHRSLALTHFEGRFGAFDNRCPHQGGPLGEGSLRGSPRRGVRGDSGRRASPAHGV